MDSTLLARFQSFASHVDMFVPCPTFDAVAAFVQGMDHAVGGCLLSGVREQLMTKLGRSSSLAWSEIALTLAFPNAPDPRSSLQTPRGNVVAIDHLLKLLDECFANLRK